MNYTPYIQALKNKDEAAFEAIYHETKHAVYAMVLPIVKDRSLAEDVMQETYTKMLSKIHTYDHKKSFMTWLLSIAKHAAIDLLRSRRDVLIDYGENEDLFVSNFGSIQKQLESEFYLSLLKEQELRIVLLKTVGGLRHTEIAEIMSMPTGTIRYIYKQAIDKMRNAVKGEGL